MSTPTPCDTGSEERRGGRDRRSGPTSPLLPLGGPRRRRMFRRAGEGVNQYVDRPRARSLVWIFAILSLCVVDAILTLVHIAKGGEELVPTMRWALTVSDELFVSIKMALTGLGAWYLLVHQNFTLGRACMRFAFMVYFGLMIYHGVVIWCRGT